MYSADKYIKNALSGFFTQREISQYSLIILNTLYNISQTDILLGRDNINDIQISEIDNIICELKNHRPIQYILGSTL